MQSLFKLCMACFIVLGLTSCASKTEYNVDFKYNIRASDDVNPDFKGEPSPIVVRVYQLADKVNFDNAEYQALFDNDHSQLANEYISSDQQLIEPGSDNLLELKISENTRFIGVIAGYRNLDDAQWRDILAVPEKRLWRDNGIEIQVDKLTIRIVKL